MDKQLNDECFVSIVIPVYNSEQTLSRCIASCLAQNIPLNSYEIILVDDGSIDNSASMIRDYAARFPIIKTLFKQNGGVSSARNAGIGIANGKYILFVDSDDAIKEHSLIEFYLSVTNCLYDLVILNSFAHYHNTIKQLYEFPKRLSKNKNSGIELLQAGYLRGSVCGIAFSKGFLLENSISFHESIMNGEDSQFVMECFLYATNIIHFNIDYYCVYLTPNSASRLWSLDKIFLLLSSLDTIHFYISSHALTSYQASMLNIRAYSVISNALYHFSLLNSLKAFPKVKRQILDSPMYPIKAAGIKLFKHKITLLNLSINLFFFPFLLRRLYHKFKA